MINRLIIFLLLALMMPVAIAGTVVDNRVYEKQGGLIQGDTTKKELTLVFTSGNLVDGAQPIMSTLKKYNVKGAFFFTGEFFELFPHVVRRLVADGHYVGSHSYGHLLYAAWENRDSLLVSREEFVKDMEQSFKVLEQFGVNKNDAPYYIPPYEYYNDSIAQWSREIGLQVINFTPGTLSSQDYTIPSMGKRYCSNKFLWNDIMKCEQRHSLNGHLLMIHLGTSPERKEKFYNMLPRLITTLRKRGYTFVPLKQLVESTSTQ